MNRLDGEVDDTSEVPEEMLEQASRAQQERRALSAVIIKPLGEEAPVEEVAERRRGQPAVRREPASG